MSESFLLQALEEQSVQEIIVPGISTPVKIRPLTIAEDTILTSANLFSVKSVYEKVLESLYKTIVDVGGRPISFDEFLAMFSTEDLSALAFGVLGISFETLSLTFTCTNCGAEIKKEIKTSSIKIKDMYQVKDYYAQIYENFFIYKLPNDLEIRIDVNPLTLLDLMQLLNCVQRISPEKLIITNEEEWLSKIVAFTFDIDDPALKTVVPNLYKISGAKEDKIIEEHIRDRIDYRLTKNETFKELEIIRQIIDRMPIDFEDKFLEQLDKIEKPKIEFEPIKYKCHKCKHSDTTEVDPLLFFLLKMLRAI